MVKRNVIKNGETDNSAYFNESDELNRRNNFSRREVGLNHPDTSAFVRLNDRGEIEIFAGEELGIIISPTSRSISIFADVVKINTKEDYGLRWNNMSMNYASDSFHEPTLVKTSEKEINSGFNYADYYLDAINIFDPIESGNNVVTINGDFAFRPESNSGVEGMPSNSQPTSISEENLNLLREYALTNTQEKVDYMKKLLESGFSFNQARQKTIRDKGV